MSASAPNATALRAESATVSPGESAILRGGASGREASITVLFLARRCAVVARVTRLAVGARQIFGDVFANLALQLFDRQARVDGNEAELARQAPVLVDEAALVALERIEQVGAEREMHPGFPVVHALAHDDAWDERLDVDVEVDDEVGHERHAEDL